MRERNIVPTVKEIAEKAGGRIGFAMGQEI